MGAQGGDRKRWIWAVGAGVAATATLAILARAPSSGDGLGHGGAVQNQQLTPVGIARFDGEAANEILEEEAMLRDPLPLFLPSQWSASADVLRGDIWRDPQTSFQDFPPKLKFAESRLALPMPAVAEVPGRAGEAFDVERAKRPFAGFGQSGAEVGALPGRVAFLEVVSAGDGQRLISQPLANAAPPADVPWQPLEFLVAVDVRGVVGSPVLTESSTVAAVDGYFQDYVVKVLHLGERLAPGFYHVGIGP